MKSRLCRLTALSCLVMATPLSAQQPAGAKTPQPNFNLYVEAGGNAGVFSLNVERKLNSHFTLRAGYGTWTDILNFSDRDEPQHARLYPLMLNFLERESGNRPNWAEAGLGIVFGERWEGVELNPHRRFSAITASFGIRKMERHVTARVGAAFRVPIRGEVPLSRLRPALSLGFWF